MDTKEKKCKIKKNEMHTRVSRSIERCRESIDKKPTSMDRESIEEIGDFSIDPPSYKEVSRL